MSASQPMGYVDTIDVADRKLTIQTEYFPRPTPRAETKVYLGGALKKTYTEDLSGAAPGSIQKILGDIHKTKMRDIVASLKERAEKKE